MIKHLFFSFTLLLVSCVRQTPIDNCDTYKSEIQNLNSRIIELENKIVSLEPDKNENSQEGQSNQYPDGSLHNSTFVSFRIVLYPDSCRYLILKHISTSSFAFAKLIKGIVPSVGDEIFNGNLDFEPTKFKIRYKPDFGATYISILESNLSKEIAIQMMKDHCTLESNE